MATFDPVACLTEQIIERIRPFCGAMHEAEVRALARDMAVIEHKYDVLELWTHARPYHPAT